MPGLTWKRGAGNTKSTNVSGGNRGYSGRMSQALNLPAVPLQEDANAFFVGLLESDDAYKATKSG